MGYSIYILHPAEDSRVLVMGSGADVKVYTARKTKLRILSLLWLRLFGLNLTKFSKSLVSSAG